MNFEDVSSSTKALTFNNNNSVLGNSQLETRYCLLFVQNDLAIMFYK